MHVCLLGTMDIFQRHHDKNSVYHNTKCKDAYRILLNKRPECLKKGGA